MPRERITSISRQYEPSEGVDGDPPSKYTEPFDVVVGWAKEVPYVTIATVNREVTESGIHIELDRGGINRLIRILRRARDQSMGEDA